MILAGLLLFFGLVMIFFEFYLPGGVMGVIGGLVLIGAIVLFSMYSPHPLLSLGFGIIVCVLFVLLIKFALTTIRHSRPESSLYLSGDQEGSKASTFDATLIGKQGVALTNLRPSGYIRVGEQRYQALSRTGYLHQGEAVKVVGGDGSHLVVEGVEKR